MSDAARELLTFHGRRAVVTGGGHGIGAATVALLSELGATVLVMDVDPDHADIVVDLSQPAEVDRAAAEAQERLGSVDILVNCAGVSIPNALRELDQAVYHRTLAVNLHAPVLLMRTFGMAMAGRGYGRIVNVTSVHAVVTEPGSLAYDISKAGLESATRTAAVELVGHGVLVNAVAPGFVATQMAITDGRNELESPEFLSVYIDRARLPAQRAAAPEEVAHAIAWLASSANTYTTGQRLTVDGGLTARF